MTRKIFSSMFKSPFDIRIVGEPPIPPVENWIPIEEYPGITVLSRDLAEGTAYIDGAYVNDGVVCDLLSGEYPIFILVKFPPEKTSGDFRVVFDRWEEGDISELGNMASPTPAVVWQGDGITQILNEVPGPAQEWVPNPVYVSGNFSNPIAEISIVFQGYGITQNGASPSTIRPSFVIELFINDEWVNVQDVEGVGTWFPSPGFYTPGEGVIEWNASGTSIGTIYSEGTELTSIDARIRFIACAATLSDPADEIVVPAVITDATTSTVIAESTLVFPESQDVNDTFPDNPYPFSSSLEPPPTANSVLVAVIPPAYESPPHSPEIAYTFRIEVKDDTV